MLNPDYQDPSTDPTDTRRRALLGQMADSPIAPPGPIGDAGPRADTGTVAQPPLPQSPLAITGGQNGGIMPPSPSSPQPSPAPVLAQASRVTTQPVASPQPLTAPSVSAGGGIDPATQRSVGESWVNFVNSLPGAQRDSTGQFGAQMTGPIDVGALVQQYNQQTGQHAQYVGGDKVDFGWGPIDVVRDIGGPNQGLWFGQDVWGNGASGAGGSGSGGAGGIGGVGSGAGGTGTPIDEAMRQTLLQLMQGANDPIDLNSPGISQPYTAASAATQRQLDQARQAMAERAYAQGSGGGGGIDQGQLTQGIKQGQEQAALGLGQFRGQLVQNEIAAKRQQVSHALDLANAIGARTEANALQAQLANLDNQYRYAALAQQQGQFQDTTAFDYAQFLAQLNRDATLAGMNG